MSLFTLHAHMIKFLSTYIFFFLGYQIFTVFPLIMPLHYTEKITLLNNEHVNKSTQTVTRAARLCNISKVRYKDKYKRLSWWSSVFKPVFSSFFTFFDRDYKQFCLFSCHLSLYLRYRSFQYYIMQGRRKVWKSGGVCK